MQYEQTRICSILPDETGEYMQYTIWQPETNLPPWAVSIEGYRHKTVTVRIYQETITRDGMATFERVRARSAREFVEFVVKMLKTFEGFSKTRIEVRPCDIRALYDGYAEGVKEARARSNKTGF